MVRYKKFLFIISLFLFVPIILLGLMMIIALLGQLLEIILNFIFYGISGLDKKLSSTFYVIPVELLEDLFSFIIPVSSFSMKLVISAILAPIASIIFIYSQKK